LRRGDDDALGETPRVVLVHLAIDVDVVFLLSLATRIEKCVRDATIVGEQD